MMILRVMAITWCLFWSGRCSAQGTSEFIRISFDGPPAVARGTGTLVQEYSESGTFFRSIDNVGFVRWGGGGQNRPDNGTAYLQAGLGSDLMFNYLNGPTFNLVSVDLAGYSAVVPDALIHFIGYHRDGSTITTDVERHGIVFETYNFGLGWSDLTRVEIPNEPWSLDNAVISIPEPSTGALLVIAVMAFGFCRRAVSVIPPRKVSDSC
jgi:PEP-CTERM motif-containing protein